jgi:hypothetical protein
MRKLKLFEDFNVEVLISNLISEIRDICLELNDEYIYTECEHHPQRGRNREFISLGLEKADSEDYNDVLKWYQVSDVITRVIDYLESQGWKNSYIIIDDESYQDTKDFIYNMTHKDDFSFYGMTLHFVKI